MIAKNLDAPLIFAGVSVYALWAFVVPVFSALRLAKFNLDTRQTTAFIGLPVPANAILLGSLPLLEWQALHNENYAFLLNIVGVPLVLGAIAFSTSLLLVSEIPLFSFKFSNLKFADNKPQFLLLLFAAISLFLIGFAALPLTIIMYIILSLIYRKS
jgi:CDP-diacylglycerol--serine O-phosphatidyltransferase